ncbi:MAG: putative addiction module antidote protein [Coriobacteriia bacterium]|nr:putative addiction module antidote protein [Coriobacteriia bacterium]
MNTLGLHKFDMAEYLESEEDIAYYLEATAEEDITLLPAALGTVARARGMSDLARSTGLSRETLYKTLSAGGNPTLSTLSKVLETYGVRISLAPINDKAAAV